MIVRLERRARFAALALLAGVASIAPGSAEAKADRPLTKAPAALRVSPQTPPPRGTRLFAVVIGPGPKWKKGQPLRKASDDHWRYWQGLNQRGLVESAGPVGKDSGMVLLRASTQRDADALLAGDPAVKAGRFRAVALPYDRTLGQ